MRDMIQLSYASKLSNEENIALTKKVAEYAKSVNPDISVEGELGYLRGSSQIQTIYFLHNRDAFREETGRDDFYDDPAVCVCDFIAGMTDRYAFNLFEKIFLPLPWKMQV